MTSHPYVILRPGDRGHVGDDPQKHLVVNVDEWLQVYSDGKDHYDFVIEHDTLSAAHNERNRLNGIDGIDGRVEDPPPAEQTEVAVPVEGSEEVMWLGAKAS